MEVSSCLDDVLAVIEHEQHLLVFEEGDQIGARLLRSGVEPELGSERDRQLEGLANRCRSTIRAPCSWFADSLSATARAAVVLPMPPGPTMVTKR